MSRPDKSFVGQYQERPDDCVRACVASIFGIPSNQIPTFHPETWGEQLEEWLAKSGLGFINVLFTGDQKAGIPRGLTLGAVPASVDFPEGWTHCVVCRDGLIIWDPKSGHQPGTNRAKEYTIIYHLDVAGLL